MVRLVNSISSHRQKFEAFCRSLSAEELDRPVPDTTWTVRDFISHLATLDPEIGRWLAGVKRGELDAAARGADGERFDIDKWNDAIVAERHDWTLDQIFEEAARNRAALIATLETLLDADIDQTVHFAGDNKRGPGDVPLKLFLFGWARHDPIHVADMLKALPERQGDAQLQAWLDDPAVKWYQDAMSGPPKR
jgi:uncharacterized damage-inducible protein DinB